MGRAVCTRSAAIAIRSLSSRMTRIRHARRTAAPSGRQRLGALASNAGAPRVPGGSPTHRGARAIHPGAASLPVPRRYAAILALRTRTRVRKSSRHHRHSSWVVPESWTSAGTTNERSPVARQQSHATFKAGSPILPMTHAVRVAHTLCAGAAPSHTARTQPPGRLPEGFRALTVCLRATAGPLESRGSYRVSAERMRSW